ncbi:MAG: sigma-70 family RNA polymerase sigma factor [Planctomycetes bacterium]|nr:sigma-70 family RNA polymerase sigma factor [Planctomycetota bacterium]
MSTEPEPADDPDGRSEGFAGAFAAAAPALLTWARLRVRPELRSLIEPEDLVQEIGCRALANYRRFDSDRGTFRQWLFGFGNRVLLEALRELGGDFRSGSRALVGGVTEAVALVTTITRRIVRQEITRLLLERVDELGEEERALLLYRGLEEMDYADLAALLGASEDTVRKRWQRLRDRLRRDPVLAALAAG